MKKSSVAQVVIHTKDYLVPGTLPKISDRGVRILDKSGTMDIEFRFTAKQMLEGSRTIKARAHSLIVDRQALRDLAPNGNPETPGYVTELSCKGVYNDSPITVLLGAPAATRASFEIVRQLSEESRLPESILKKLASDDLMLTTLCAPSCEFPPGSCLREAVEITRERDGVISFTTCEEGIMSQNPKAMLIIDECAGATEKTLQNTYVPDKAKGAIHTPSTSLLSAIVRCYPSAKVTLAWDDVNDAEFDVAKDALFFIPARIANDAISEIMRRKDIVKPLRMAVNDVEFAIQTSTMHGNWQYEGDTDSYFNTDNGRRVDAVQEFTVRARIAISVRYVNIKVDSCALARDHQFYPMPVWPKSKIGPDNLPRKGAKHYPNSFHEQVAARTEELLGEHGRKRRAAMLRVQSEAASSSVADDE